MTFGAEKFIGLGLIFRRGIDIGHQKQRSLRHRTDGKGKRSAGVGFAEIINKFAVFMMTGTEVSGAVF